MLGINLFGEDGVCEEIILGKVKVQSEAHRVPFTEGDLDVFQKLEHWRVIFLHTARLNISSGLSRLLGAIQVKLKVQWERNNISILIKTPWSRAWIVFN